MTKLKPNEKTPKWPGGSAVERINSCRAMLYLHGFLTDGESNKVVQRMNAWVKAHSPDSGEVKS